MFQQRTVLFIDEIHRFNKAQQDAVLPYVEDGTIILIGATTENPSFEVNGALLSRTAASSPWRRSATRMSAGWWTGRSPTPSADWPATTPCSPQTPAATW